MKKSTLKIAFMLLSVPVFSGLEVRGQSIPVWDVVLTEILIAQNKSEFKRRVDLKDNHVSSTATIALTRTQGNVFKDNVAKLHSRLTSVAGLISAGSILIEVPAIIKDIKNYEQEALKEVYKNPAYFPLAFQAQRNLIDASKKLVRFADLIIITASDLNAMKQGDRILIAYELIQKLRTVRAIAFGFYVRIRAANSGNLLQQKDLWKGYIDMDKKLAKDILDNFKF